MSLMYLRLSSILNLFYYCNCSTEDYHLRFEIVLLEHLLARWIYLLEQNVPPGAGYIPRYVEGVRDMHSCFKMSRIFQAFEIGVLNLTGLELQNC